MKKILGLDLGTTSIGWALVNQAENKEEKSSIIRAGVRIVPLDSTEKDNFEKGKEIQTNAGRTAKRSARRNLDRFQQRRSKLIGLFVANKWIESDALLSENGNRTTFETYMLRSKAASEPISLQELARVLLMINKKRGYKSNRKTDSGEEGHLVDGMQVAKILSETSMTPGQYGLKCIKEGQNYIPEFYRSDLQKELDLIWDFQRQFHNDILTEEFKRQISGRGRQDVSKIFYAKYKISTADNKGKTRKLQAYTWRKDALEKELEKEVLAYVICDLSAAIRASSGYLGEISDRSKELLFSGKTIGQYLYDGIKSDSNFSVRKKVFYRQDYIDEFNRIWDCQSKSHKELTPELRDEIRDRIIFYQRPLKSQKGLVSICELEQKTIEINKNGVKVKKVVGPKVAPKSSLVFQEFKIWQILNNISITDRNTGEIRSLEIEEKRKLAKELQTRDRISASEALAILFGKAKGFEINYKNLEGNHTFYQIAKALVDIVNRVEGLIPEFDIDKRPTEEVIYVIEKFLCKRGLRKGILDFDASLEKKEYEAQPLFKLWHLLYSYEGDNSRTGDESLIQKISAITGLPEELSGMLSKVAFKDDYASLSHMAMRRILPYMKDGNKYDVACAYAGYNHSRGSRTREQIDNAELVDKLDVLPRNSLRNPVVEKILNQMINVVNAVGEEYGRPDEIHIEMARELKQNRQQRESTYNRILETDKENRSIVDILQKEFGIKNVRKTDIVRYKLYQELKDNSYKAKTLYSNKYISREILFSNEIDIEHIIPQASLFDDSFSNKTLEFKEVNLQKGKMTAYDYVASKGEEELHEYIKRVEDLYARKVISQGKRNKLLMSQDKIPEDFLNRDLSMTQYIARKACEILESYVREILPTNGAITARLREDWQLVDVMKELNLPKYDAVGMTHYEERNGKMVKKIDLWSKRDDHRHHAMDALTIAFTKKQHIQYLNNLNARSDKSSSIYGIEQNETIKRGTSRIFIPPMPLNELRAAFKKELESILVSNKASNKIVTRNVNKTKKNGGVNKRTELTPRGQLHKETVYGQIKVPEKYMIAVGAKLTEEEIARVTSKKVQDALIARLSEFGGDPKKAFTGKNSLQKNPIYLDSSHTQSVDAKVEGIRFKTLFTVRKPISPDLNIEKVVDAKVRNILLERVKEYGDARKAFSNLDENPIWLNKDKSIQIKSVTIGENFDLDAIRVKRDNNGRAILTSDGKEIPTDFVNLRNNHHVAIYETANGDYEEKVVSFFEALQRVSNGMPAVDRTYRKDDGWKFVFTLKKGEVFVFPNSSTGFDPSKIDLMDKANYPDISKNLFRVQKFSSNDYNFRHHLETSTENPKELQNITWKRLKNTNALKGAIKVRINHLGEIVHIGEYD